MPKIKSVKYRRKFYSLYLDTIALLVLSLLLVMIVWLSMRSMPVLEAIQSAKAASSQTKEHRMANKPKFVVKYGHAKSLTPAKSPELIAFGESKSEDFELYNLQLLEEYGFDREFSAPQLSIKKPKLYDNEDIPSNPLLSLHKPTVSVNVALNVSSMKTENVSTNLEVTATNVYWNLPKTIQGFDMPNIESLMRKYGWLFGSLDIVLTVGAEGFVSNVIICSDDIVDGKLLRELKGEFLALHLGKQNANTTIPIGVSWNLP